MNVETVVLHVLAQFDDVPRSWLFSRTRTCEVAEARLALYLALCHAGMTRCAIGRALGRHHSAVTHGVRRAKGLMETCPGYSRKLGHILKDLDAAGITGSMGPASVSNISATTTRNAGALTTTH